MKRFAVFFIALILAPALALASPAGLWSRSNDQGETKIEITPNGEKFTGTIAWMENPRNDAHNPDKDLRDRLLVGVQIFNDMEQVSPDKWDGSLYNPEDGKTYSGSLTVIDENTLKLKGCAFIIFCKSDTWKRTTLSVKN